MMRRFFLFVLAAASFSTYSSAFSGEISRCVLEVHQAVFLDGACNFETGSDGSFTMGVGDTAAEASLYFAYIAISETDNNRAVGY